MGNIHKIILLALACLVSSGLTSELLTSDLYLSSLLGEIEGIEAEHEMLQSRLAMINVTATEKKATMRHNTARTALFSATSTTATCGPNFLTSWTTLINRLPFGSGTGGFSNGVYTASIMGSYYISTCHACGTNKDYACDIEIQVNGVQQAALGRRDNNRDSYGTFCQFVLLKLEANDQVRLYFSSGGDCLYQNSNTGPYSTFNAWLLVGPT